jgi:hypothetical protein
VGSFEDALALFDKMLVATDQSGMLFSWEELQFMVRELRILGFYVSKDGITPDPETSPRNPPLASAKDNARRASLPRSLGVPVQARAAGNQRGCAAAANGHQAAVDQGAL